LLTQLYLSNNVRIKAFIVSGSQPSANGITPSDRANLT
jgi:hypothetical protein